MGNAPNNMFSGSGGTPSYLGSPGNGIAQPGAPSSFPVDTTFADPIWNPNNPTVPGMNMPFGNNAPFGQTLSDAFKAWQNMTSGQALTNQAGPTFVGSAPPGYFNPPITNPLAPQNALTNGAYYMAQANPTGAAVPGNNPVTQTTSASAAGKTGAFGPQTATNQPVTSAPLPPPPVLPPSIYQPTYPPGVALPLPGTAGSPTGYMAGNFAAAPTGGMFGLASPGTPGIVDPLTNAGLSIQPGEAGTFTYGMPEYIPAGFSHPEGLKAGQYPGSFGPAASPPGFTLAEIIKSLNEGYDILSDPKFN